MFETKRVFSHNIYSQDALSETQAAYGELLTANFSEDEQSTEVEFTTDDENGAMFVDAFCNHVLFLSIQNHRQGSPE